MTLTIVSSDAGPVVSEPVQPPVRVVLATPCGDMVHAGFALDLAKLIGYMARTRPDIELVAVQNRGTILPQQRATLVMAAQEMQATHLLFIDSDMRFPKEALERLLAHDTPIVAANYPTRRAPVLPTAQHKQHGYLFTPDDAEGLAEVTHCGMGLMLIQMAVFETLAQPWFHLGFTPKGNEYVGEDFFFCWKARDAGITTYIDQGLSVHVRHAGEIEFSQRHANLTRDVSLEREQQSQREEAARGA